MDIKTVGVIGAGTMGNGIAHVFAKSGYSVVLLDVEQRFVDRGMDTIRKNLEREVAKGKLSAEQRDQAVSGIKGVTERSALGACDFIVEAASERFEIKAELFRDLEAALPARSHPEFQHLIHFNNQAGVGDEASRQSYRNAFFQSRCR